MSVRAGGVGDGEQLYMESVVQDRSVWIRGNAKSKQIDIGRGSEAWSHG